MITGSENSTFPLILLAGRRTDCDPLCDGLETCYKSLTPVAGLPMIIHVLRNLDSCQYISEILILSQEPEFFKQQLAEYAFSKPVRFVKSTNGIATTVLNTWDAMELEPPLFVTTADNCLLRKEHLDNFLFKAINSDSDLAVGFVDKMNITRIYPETRRTWLNFRDMSLTGCNLYLFLNNRAKPAIRTWSRYESTPKKIFKIAWSLGPLTFVRYLIRNISAVEAFQKLSTALNTSITPVTIDNPDVAIDADKRSDVRQIEMILDKNPDSSRLSCNKDAGQYPLVIFDLDRTITTVGTYFHFLVYYSQTNQPFRLLLLPLVAAGMLAYKLGIIDRKQLKTLMFAMLAGSPGKTTLESACVDYVEYMLANRVYLDALFTLRKWQNEGARLVLATASFDWLAGEFARRLKFDHLVCTRSRQRGGKVIPGIDGENCYGRQKLRMLEEQLGSLHALCRSGREVWFYTDHHSDIPLLDQCTHPVAVNASVRLRKWVRKVANGRELDWQGNFNSTASNGVSNLLAGISRGFLDLAYGTLGSLASLKTGILTLVATFLAISSPALLLAVDKIELSEVPASIIDTVKLEFPNMILSHAAIEMEDGQMIYELEGMNDNIEYEIEVSVDGWILEVEQED